MVRSGHSIRLLVRMAVLAAAALVFALLPAWGQEAPRGEAEAPAPVPAREPKQEAPARQPAQGVGRQSLLNLVKQANPMLWPLALTSVVTLGFALERGFALRKGRVLPKDFVNRFVDRLAAGKLDRDRASELCRSNESPIARIFGHAVRYWGQPASEIRQALDHDAAVEVLDLRRNVRVLNACATIAPLLGLLGTIVGMVESFEAIGAGQTAGEAKSAALAHGISLALMATAVGLGIAVVSVAFYYYYLQRVDVLAKEIDQRATEVIDLIASDPARAVSPRAPMHPPGGGEYHRESRPLGRTEPV